MSYVAKHMLTVLARCPADATVRDVYDMMVEVEGQVVEVEDLLKIAREFEDIAIWQEHLTQQFADKIGLEAKVTTVGVHSGVETTVVAKTEVMF